MVTNVFKAAASVLRNHVSDTYALLDAAASVEAMVTEEVAAATTDAKRAAYPHWLLVRIASENEAVLAAVREGNKIKAIVALRNLFRPDRTQDNQTLSLVGLRAAKDAIEDPAIMSWFGIDKALASDPWAVPVDRDEPPF